MKTLNFIHNPALAEMDLLQRPNFTIRLRHDGKFYRPCAGMVLTNLIDGAGHSVGMLGLHGKDHKGFALALDPPFMRQLAAHLTVLADDLEGRNPKPTAIAAAPREPAQEKSQ